MTAQDIIEWEQKLLLMLAQSYNTEENPMASDAIYDYSVSVLQDLKARYPEEWQQSSMYPQVFQDPEQAWTFTSQHFPVNEEIAEWIVVRKVQVKQWMGRLIGKTSVSKIE